MTSRILLGALALALTLAGTALGAPLAGTGKNIVPVSTLEIDDSQKNELELAGDYAYVDYDDGFDIVNISDPTKPRTVGEHKCTGSGGDIDLSPDAKIAVRATAHAPAKGPCKEAGTAATIYDISDKTNPRMIAKIDLEDAADPFGIYGDYTHTVTLDGKWLYLNPQTAAFYPQRKQRIRVFDVSNPAKPVHKADIQFTQGVQAVAHDSFVDHRPDGKSLLYAASVHTTDVFDVTDPLNAKQLQRITSPEMTISHQAQPNFDRSQIIVVDESAVDAGPPAGAMCGHGGGPGPAAADVGATHFYEAAKDGTFANNGAAPMGSFAPAPTRTEDTCTAHVFWPAPKENRLVQAYYTLGAKVLDHSDPGNVKELGSFVADKPTIYWSAKPHRGYIFATDMDRGLDILRYTGEGAAKWPTTAGPAEIQRSQWQGMPYVPLDGVSRDGGQLPAPKNAPGTSGSGGDSAKGESGAGFGRAIGRIRFTIKMKGLSRTKRSTFNLTFYNANGKKVGSTVRFKKKGAKRSRTTTISVNGAAVPGAYRWTLKRGTKRVVKRGRLTVKATPGMSLSQPHTIYALAK